MNQWVIIFYSTNSDNIPVIEYIKAQEAKRANEIYNALILLKEFGIEKSLLAARKLKGKFCNGLYELKIDTSRILYFLHTDRRFIMVHAFTKKKNKTPRIELEIAIRRMKDYLR
ncbi:MAG: type II toxin-antitoxin system RelE/ParE family toxin [Candidatus Humimicrobiaceae bacterium]